MKKSSLIRLAHENPKLRPHLLPLITATWSNDTAIDEIAKMSDQSNVVRIAADKPVTAEQLDLLITKSFKRIDKAIRAMGMGAVVTLYPLGIRTNDWRGEIKGGFSFNFKHPDINPIWRPGISFYWSIGDNQGQVSSFGLVWGQKEVSDNTSLAQMNKAMMSITDAIVKDLQKQLEQKEKSDEVWSIATKDEDGYAKEVDTFESRESAEEEARDRGNCYVIKGTQMWNEPIGQVEEHDRQASYHYFK